MSTPLEIVVTGNVDGAKSGLQVIQGELGKTVSGAKNAGDAFDVMSKQMQQFQRAAQNTLNPQLIQVYNTKVQELQASMRLLASQADAEALSVENATANMSKMAVVSDATAAGQARLSSAIQRSTNPYQIAAREVNNFSRRLLYFAGAGVMQLAIEAFSDILPYIENFFGALDKSGDSAKLAAENLANYNAVMADANKQAGQQIADLKILYATATDVNVSMKDRLAAVKALQKEFPDYFGNIKAETILNGDAKKSYDDLTASIIANSRAKAVKSQYDILEAQRLDIDTQRDKIRNASDNQISRIYENGPRTLSGGSQSSFGTGTGGNVVQSIAEQIAGVNKSKNAALEQLVKLEKNINDQEDALRRISPDSVVAKSIEDAQKKDKQPKKVNQFEIDLKGLEDNYKKAQSLLVSTYDANLTNAKSNTTAINDFILKAQLDFEEKKLALIKRYGKGEGDTLLEIAKTNLAIIKNQVAFTVDQINTLPKIENAPKLGKNQTQGKIDKNVTFDYSDAIKKNMLLQAEMITLIKNTTNELNKGLGPAFDALFTNILEGSHNAFKAFTDALKQTLVQLGAAVLKAAVFAGILSLVTGGAGGGGLSFLSAFNSVFKLAKGGPVKGFASGGVSGPGTSTSDSIPAFLSNGEYVMNAAAVSKFGHNFFNSLNSGMLPGFSKGGTVGSNLVVATNSTYIPDVTLRGQDLIIAFNRATQRASRNG